MKKHLARLLIVSVVATPYAVNAETLLIPVGQQQQTIPLPTTGMNQQQVIAEFGEPQTKGEAVGEPPIVRWQYDGFTVYFETGHVIHSVAQFRRGDSRPITIEEAP